MRISFRLNNEFKKFLLVELRSELDALISGENVEVVKFCETKKGELTGFSNNRAISSIKEIQKHIQKLQVQQTTIIAENKPLNKQVDDLQHDVMTLEYMGVKAAGKETNTDMKTKLIDIVRENEIDISEDAADRVHRVGRKKTNKGVTTQPIMVRFKPLSDQIVFCKSRPSQDEGYR